MKKFLAILLSLVMVLSLAACSKEGNNDAPPLYGTFHVEAMAKAGAFSEELEELDADIAFALYKLADYGLAREELTDCAVLRSAGATCEEGAVLVLSGEKAAKSAGDALKTYVQGQIDANVDYLPAEIPKLEGAYIDVKGSTVLMVVADNLDAAKDAVK